MTTPLGTDLTLYWNGTQITGTSGSVTRSLKRLPEFSPFEQKVPTATLVGATEVLAEQGDPEAQAMRCTLHLSHKASGLASALLVERTLMDELRAYQAILNPMAGVIEGFRWALLGSGNLPALALTVSCAAASLLLLIGGILFHRMERDFADVV